MAPAPAFCRANKRLVDEYVVAVSMYLRANSDLLITLIRGEDFQHDDEIEAARKVKDGAKRAIMEHRRLHGC